MLPQLAASSILYDIVHPATALTADRCLKSWWAATRPDGCACKESPGPRNRRWAGDRAIWVIDQTPVGSGDAVIASHASRRGNQIACRDFVKQSVIDAGAVAHLGKLRRGEQNV